MWVGIDAVSQSLIDATIAVEDATFYTNPGVDARRIAGAALQNLQEGEVVSGASTITMQLARNLFLGPDQRYDQSVDRKVLEAGLAQELTELYSKDEILEMYLNLLNYGQLAYGPEAAAQVYFGKSAAELTLSEASMLAGIPQQPANLNPYDNWDAARARQRTVLDLMVRHGMLTAAEADAAFADAPVLAGEPGLAPEPCAALCPGRDQPAQRAVGRRLYPARRVPGGHDAGPGLAAVGAGDGLDEGGRVAAHVRSEQCGAGGVAAGDGRGAGDGGQRGLYQRRHQRAGQRELWRAASREARSSRY